MVCFPRHLPMSRTPVKTGWWRASGPGDSTAFRYSQEWIRLSKSRPDCWADNVTKVYNSEVESHTFRRTLQGRRFLCHKTSIPSSSYCVTRVVSTVESFAGRNQGDPMSESVDVQYVGFEAKALARVYSFVVRRALNQTSEFTLSIGNEAFGSRRVRFQDAPEICSLRLHHELAAFGNHPPVAHYHISETDLDDYRSSHAPKVSGYPYKPKPPQDV